MKTLRLILGVLLLSILLWSLWLAGKLELEVSGRPTLSTSEFHPGIMQATLQILVYPNEGGRRERGIGTLVSFAGEDLVVTHNHWDFLGDLRKVEILDAKDNLLMAISALEFKNLIRYGDRGTLIFSAPDGLQASPARLGNLEERRVGDVITVVHQASDNDDPLELLRAEVRAIDDFNGLPVIRFIPLDGREIKPGDSGGGVWLAGRFIGNTWGMYFQEDKWFLPRSQEMQITNVAQLPFYFLELMRTTQSSYQSEEQGENLTDLKKDRP